MTRVSRRLFPLLQFFDVINTSTNMCKGFMRISREKVTEFEWLSNPNTFYVFMRLLFKANYKDGRWEGNEVKRGQLITGRKSLSEELNLSEQQIRTCLDKLQRTGYITIKATNKFSIITICNYDGWQNETLPSNQQDNQQITNNQPTNNQQITTIEELKEEINKLKKEKEELTTVSKKKDKIFVPPTIEEVSAYISEKGYHFDGTAFVDFYASKGWMVGKNKMKDWKAACGTWERKRLESGGLFSNSTPEPKPQPQTNEQQTIDWQS